MILVHKLEQSSMGRVRSLYERFSQKASQDYGWTSSPIDYETLEFAIRKQLMAGYFLTVNDPQAEPMGLMLYRLEEHRAVEINLIYLEDTPFKSALDVLMPQFIEDVRQLDGWDVISYALLGKQEEYVLTLPWYGFKPIGQTIFKFDMLDVLSVQIFKQQKFEPLPDEYRITAPPLTPHGSLVHKDAIAECIYDAFCQSVDTLWDPRFRSVLGCQEVVRLIESNLMGDFLPTSSRFAFRGDDVVGFSFLVESTAVSANVPVIGTHRSVKGLGIGSRMLWQGMDNLIDEALASRSNYFAVDATTDTDNYPALHMYRRLGFREQQNYPHVYLPREKAMTYQRGKWC
jgi:ribosomal protein S18 acetylase RimI-like enzyme